MSRITNSAGAWTGDGSGYSRPVRPQDADKSLPPETFDHRSPSQRAADDGLAEHYRVKKLLADAAAVREAERQQVRDENQRREAEAQAARDREANRRMIEMTLDQYGFQGADRQKVHDQIEKTGRSDMESVEVTCMTLKANKAQAAQQRLLRQAEPPTSAERIAAVRGKCTPEMWGKLVVAILTHSKAEWENGWTPEDIASGEAHERTFAGLFE